uniref:Ionotropic receptor 75a N-terminal domain-containing protein n=1 Tax=Anopheles atroparvus TaxID=41427 RepID=A0AAG5DGE4_ANOAO
IIFDCRSEQEQEAEVIFERKTVLKAAGARSTSVRFVDISTASRPRHNVTTIFTPRLYAKCCCVLDYTCPGASGLLEEVSKYRLLNNTFSWLLLPRTTANRADVHRVLWNTTGIQMNTD